MEMKRIAVEKEQRENMEHRERVEEALKLLRRDVRHSRTELEVLANILRKS
ncbi:hypothetical protein ZHAS_00010902 [Anopheles sinensis]|uniref:Uncharacterized protein n=1 Tax=Anopheles sinensis TaxID=74873 RepID=A0A084VYR2_ANOSI|nr:hypothetical protein ZHAS_00010902 [Anopheles sinensis]